ncbi:MAG: glutathione peroxidase [Planctomycetota bacterium]
MHRALFAVCACAALIAPVHATPEEGQPVYQHTVKSIDGEDVNLADYEGKVLLVVNVASQCGFTKQYAGLEKLYRELKDQGLVVLGFPCNQFGGQEPGTEEEIKTFCESKFDVSFPLFAKVDVKGEQQAPLYKALTDAKGEIKWNFTKFLVARDGTILAKFDSRVAPDAEELRQAIAKALEAPAPAK